MNRKHGVLGAVLVLAIPLVVAATAFACGSLATLKLNRATASAGDQVQARGGNFNTSPRASTVLLRFNSRNGRILWEGRPNQSGRFTASFAAPAVRRGYYVVVATQTGPDGRPAAGTPGRAPLRMKRRARASGSSVTAPTAWTAPPTGGGGSRGPEAAAVPTSAAIGIGLLTVVLLGGGVLVRSRIGRRRRFDVARSVS